MEPFTTFDFQQAKTRHLLFKSRLRAILYDEGDVEDTTVLSQYACPVGKWIYSHALIQYEYEKVSMLEAPIPVNNFMDF
ncbi:hypothetical protein GCM10028808_51470 [Spirosoma migulaei]